MITCFNIIVNSHSRMHPSELTAQRLGKHVNMQKSFRLCLFCRFLCVHLPPSLPPDLSIDPCAPIHPAPSSTQTASLSAVGVSEGGQCQVVFEKQAVVGVFSFFTQRPNLWERGNISWQLSSAPLAVPCDEFFNWVAGLGTTTFRNTHILSPFGRWTHHAYDLVLVFHELLSSELLGSVHSGCWHCFCFDSAHRRKRGRPWRRQQERERKNEGGGEVCLATMLTSLTTAGPGSYVSTHTQTHWTT